MLFLWIFQYFRSVNIEDDLEKQIMQLIPICCCTFNLINSNTVQSNKCQVWSKLQSIASIESIDDKYCSFINLPFTIAVPSFFLLISDFKIAIHDKDDFIISRYNLPFTFKMNACTKHILVNTLISTDSAVVEKLLKTKIYFILSHFLKFSVIFLRGKWTSMRLTLYCKITKQKWIIKL